MVRVMMEVMMLVAVDDEDGVQWRQGGGAFNGGGIVRWRLRNN